MDFFKRHQKLFEANDVKSKDVGLSPMKTQKDKDQYLLKGLRNPQKKQYYHHNNKNDSFRVKHDLPPILPGYKTPHKKQYHQNNSNIQQFHLQNQSPSHLSRLKRYSLKQPTFAPLLPAYRQSRSLNKKIKSMKEDYEQFDHFLQHKNSKKSNLNNPQEQQLWKSLNEEVKRQKQQNNPLDKRREKWLNGQQKSLIKYTQLDHLFSNQFENDQYRNVRKIKDSIVPRSLDFMSPPIFNTNYFSSAEPVQIFRPRHRMQSKDTMKEKKRQDNFTFSSLINTQSEQILSQAMKRRNFAKMNILKRREKLTFVLKTSW